MPRRRTDELARGIEDSLALGIYVGYSENWGFVEDLEAVRARIAPLIEGGEEGKAGRAVGLLEMFIGGCYEKSGEIDDSSGNFG